MRQNENKNQPSKEEMDAILDGVLNKLTGGRTPEEIQLDLENGKWPFAVSEEQMRADIERVNDFNLDDDVDAGQ